MLGLKLWDLSVFEDFMFAADQPPAYLREGGNASAADGWHRVRLLREQLQAADRSLRRQERAARRAKDAVDGTIKSHSSSAHHTDRSGPSDQACPSNSDRSRSR